MTSLAFSPSFATDGYILGSSFVVNGPAPAHTMIEASTDWGQSFEPVATSGLPLASAVSDLAFLPDHAVLAALVLYTPQGLGVRCSQNGGVIWSLAC